MFQKKCIGWHRNKEQAEPIMVPTRQFRKGARIPRRGASPQTSWSWTWLVSRNSWHNDIDSEMGLGQGGKRAKRKAILKTGFPENG